MVSWLISPRVWKAGYCSNLSWQVPVQEFSKTVISVHSHFVNTPEEPAAFMFSLPADGSRGSYQTLVSSNRTKQRYTSVFPFKCTYCPVSLLLKKHDVFSYSLFVQHSTYLVHGTADAKYFHGNILSHDVHFANEYFILTEHISLSHTCKPTLTRTSCMCVGARACTHTHTQRDSKRGWPSTPLSEEQHAGWISYKSWHC